MKLTRIRIKTDKGVFEMSLWSKYSGVVWLHMTKNIGFLPLSLGLEHVHNSITNQLNIQ